MHWLPVADDDAHVGDHRLDGSRERVESCLIALTVDLGMHEQQTIDDRTEQEVHLVAIAREELVHAVDDEREVVGGDQDDSVRRLPSVAGT